MGVGHAAWNFQRNKLNIWRKVRANLKHDIHHLGKSPQVQWIRTVFVFKLLLGIKIEAKLEPNGCSKVEKHEENKVEFSLKSKNKPKTQDIYQNLSDRWCMNFIGITEHKGRKLLNTAKGNLRSNKCIQKNTVEW